MLAQHFPTLTPAQLQQFEALLPLYKEWNEKINVVSRQDVENLTEKHILHSLAIARVQPFAMGSLILDVGTGGGFPGIPLAIMFPEVEFVLVDSIGKKIKVVQAVAEGVGLKNVKSYHKRAEQMDLLFDFAVSRAVAPLKELIGWTRKNVSKNRFHDLANGLICLKGGDLKAEISEAKMPGIRMWDVDVLLPGHAWFAEKKVVHVPYR